MDTMHNHKLWKYYPIGFVTAMFSILEDLRLYLDEEEREALVQVSEALYRFDNIVRAKRHPLPKRGKR